MIDDDIFDKLPIEKKYEITENTMRKDFTFSEMCDIIDDVKPTLELEAEKRRKAGAKLAPGKEKFKARDILAACLKVSHGQLEKIDDIKNAVKENRKKFGDIPKRIDKGMSVDYAYQMIMRDEYDKKPIPPLPKGKFDLIYTDIPWEYNLPLQGAPPYKTMSTEEAMKLKIPAHKDCVLFFWVTGPKIEDGIQVLNAWGFKLKTMIIWVKTKDKKLLFEEEIADIKLQQTTGYYVRGAHEILFIATKGSPGVPAEKDRPPSVLLAERREHSKKPFEMYSIIERMYPSKKKKLELFSRIEKKDRRPHWHYWGDELEQQ